MLVHFEQVLSDLKGYRTILVKKLFRLKMFTLLETIITSFLVFVLFSFCAVWACWSILSKF